MAKVYGKGYARITGGLCLRAELPDGLTRTVVKIK